MTKVLEVPSLDEGLKAIGAGIHAFSTIEFGLAVLYATLMEPADRTKSVRTLEEARHFEIKMCIIEAVGQLELTGALLKSFNDTTKRARSLAKFRNKLAHWTVSVWPGARSAAEAEKWKVALVPPMTSRHWGKVMYGGKQPVQIKQVAKYVADCNQLTLAIFALSQQIENR